MYNARHEQEAYWNNEHILPCTSEIYTASEGDRYEKSVIYEIIETSWYTRWFDYKPPPFWSNSLSQLLNLVQDVL